MKNPIANRNKMNLKKLLDDIETYFGEEKNPFAKNLFIGMTESIRNFTLDNPYLFNLIELFDIVGNSLYDDSTSQCFDRLIKP